MRLVLSIFLGLLAPVAFAQSPVDVMRGRTTVAQTDTLVNSTKTAPQFPGGHTALMDYVAYRIKYPKALRRQKFNVGPMTVKFLIGTNGRVSDVQVMSRPTPPEVAEAMSDYVTNIVKVFQKMPRWEPARLNGVPIAYQYSLPFQVEIN